LSRYLFYFFYWHSPEDELKVVLDFDSSQKAIEMLNEVQEEIMYHIGEEFEIESTNIQLIEPYGLRPFSEKIWKQPLDLFVSKYGNEFVIIDLNNPTIGLIQHIRKNTPINTIRPRNVVETYVTGETWNIRTKLELRLITSLIRWLQFTQKRNWLQVVPDEVEKHHHRVWQIETIIPDTDSYTATWKAILPKKYPDSAPKLFIKFRDRWVVREVDEKIIWIDSKGDRYFLVKNIDEVNAGWTNTQFLCDWLLSGFWNFLARELSHTYPIIKMYQDSVGLKDYSSLFPGELEDYESDETKLKIKEVSLFITWFCQRIPEKANEILQKIHKVIPVHEIYSKLGWRYIIQNIDCVSLEMFYKNIENYFLDEKKEINDRDIASLKELEKKCSESNIAVEYENLIKTILTIKHHTVKLFNLDE
jgi:hypothetical protein